MAQPGDDQREEDRATDRVERDTERLEDREAVARRQVEPPEHAGHDRVHDRDPADPYEEGRDRRQPARFSSNVHIDTLSLDGPAPRVRPIAMVGRRALRGDGAGTRPARAHASVRGGGRASRRPRKRLSRRR